MYPPSKAQDTQVRCRAVTAREPHRTVTGTLVLGNSKDILYAVDLRTERYMPTVPVKADSIKYLSGFADEAGHPVCVGDRVTLCGVPGVIVFELGAFGVGFSDGFYVPWTAVWEKIQSVNTLNSRMRACINDNFISFWELADNMDLDIYCENIPVPGLKLADTDGGK